jgi:tetratricopeptide (TPR) repeat protein
MQILHKVDDFLYELFPKAKQSGNNLEVLKEEVSRYYAFGPYKPTISVKDGWLKITIDTSIILSQEYDFKKVVSLCERQRYSEAKPILSKLIEKNKTNSEYYRIYGQIFSEEGNQDDAIDCLIDSLRWDPKNAWALIMMGNIFAKYKGDISTATKYYDQAIKVDPKNNIAMNNIGANLMKQGQNETAKKYFHEAIKINSNYPNTYYALGLIAEMENDLWGAFNNATISIKKNNNPKDALFQNSIDLAFSIAKKIIDIGGGCKFRAEYLHRLEFQCGTKIELIEDSSIPTAAKFELAENYNRSNHIVRYNSDYPAVVHLQMHELVHLAFIIEARKADANLLFITTQKQKADFIKGIEPTITKLGKMGVPEKAISDFCSSIFHGINLQIFNAPIDLFIENFLYSEFEELRPYQFISLFNLLKKGLKAVTDKEIIDHSPANILSKSKILNVVNALHFKELYGIDLVSEFNASSSEFSKAKSFYNEFLQHRETRKPAEEYEIVLNWAEKLGLEKYFEFVNEKEYRTKRTDIDGLLESIENDPYDLGSKDIYKKRNEEKFQKSQREMGTNMAVAMYMVDALNYFKSLPKEKIKEIAFEIAFQGTHGFSPDKKGYIVNSIPGKEFSGYHILAYYYVSWKLAVPEMVSQLNLPYEGEFELALKLQQK